MSREVEILGDGIMLSYALQHRENHYREGWELCLRVPFDEVFRALELKRALQRKIFCYRTNKTSADGQIVGFEIRRNRIVCRLVMSAPFFRAKFGGARRVQTS